jgi:DNA-binding CsgD family transcriptional regulator
MSARPPIPTARADIIGRGAERQRLREIVDGVATGHGGVVLLSGEPGIGKTILAEYALELARDRGFRVIEGRCDPLSRSLAYGPIVHALRPVLGDLTVGERSAVTADLRALGRIIPGIDLGAAEPVDDPSLERARLLEAFLRLIDRLARDAPLALFVDDLHWADRSTLELLAYVGHDVPSLPVLVVLAFQREAGAESRDLADFIAAIRRSSRADELVVDRLSDPELAALVAAVMGAQPPATLTEFVAGRSGGNPLFARALVVEARRQGLLVEVDGEWQIEGQLDVLLPRAVRETVVAILARLAPDERRIADLVSVGGDAVEIGVLAEVAGGDPSAAVDGLERSGILVQSPDVSVAYEMAHPLFRDVTYDELPASLRRAIHASYLSAYERLAPDSIDRLAVHAVRSMPETDPQRVLDVSMAAGHQALDRLAGPEAVAHFTVAVELARRHRPEQVGAILELLAASHALAGDRAAAAAAYDDALGLLGSEAKPTERARIHLLAARVLGDAEFDASDVHVELALSSLAASTPTELDLELLLIAAVNAHRRADAARVESIIGRVIELGRHLTGARALALVSAARLTALLQRCEYAEAEREIARGDLAKGGSQHLGRQQAATALIAAVKGDLPMLRRANAEIVEVARRVGLPSWIFRVAVGRFVDAFYSGEWDRADEMIDDIDRLATQQTNPMGAAMGYALEVMLLAYRAEFDRAAAVIGSLRELAGIGGHRRAAEAIGDVAVAIVELERGDARAALARLERRTDMPMSGSMPPWDLVAKGEALARTGRSDESGTVAERLRSMAGAATYPEAMADRITGLAAAAAGNPGLARSNLERAWQAFGELRLPFEEARAGLELAELRLPPEPSGTDDTGRLIDWHAMFDRLGAARYAGRARRVLAALGHEVVTGAKPADLTSRQLEIATLVAAGLPNAEIAERLFLSVRTVTSHLDHIYTRLGIGSRAALAAYVVARQPESWGSTEGRPVTHSYR